MSEHLDVLTSEVALCVLLYALFRPLGATLALMLASFRLVMTAIHGANLLNQFVVLNLIGEGGDGRTPGGLHSVALLLVPGYAQTPITLAVIIAVAEIAFPLWLLIKGVDIERWWQRAAAA